MVKSVFKTSTCSFSVLGLYKLVKTKFFASMVTRYGLCCQTFGLKFGSNCPKKPIKTPQELDNTLEKKFISPTCLIKFSGVGFFKE